MAKDPAFLFYSSDFLTGTMTMTDEQVGKYIRLLCLQHQKGILSENDMIFICKSDESIYSKFIKTPDGYFNQRLREEAEKRANFCLSRGKNKEGKLLKDKKIKHKKIKSKSYDTHMEDVNEDVIVNKNTVVIYFEKKELNDLFIEYLEIRKKNKKLSITDSIIERLKKKINEAPESDKKIMIEKAILGGWADFYSVKKEFTKEKDPRFHRNTDEVYTETL